MRDLFSWSLPLGRIFGVTVRVHWLLPVVALGMILRAAYHTGALPGTWLDASMLMGLLFLSVLLHEFGHCFGARMVDGDAHEILLWPLGGLASVEVPHTPRANFIATLAGPLVNLFLCIGSGLMLVLLTEPSLRPPWNPFWYACRVNEVGAVLMYGWDGTAVEEASVGIIVLARFFWVNWILLLLNICIWGFPLDGGRLFQCALWPKFGYRTATVAAIYSGFIFAIILIVASLAANDVWPFFLAVFIYATCSRQLFILETGGEESLFGYDFSQGYTSLEREQPVRTRKESFWQRWRRVRAQKKMQREQEQREAEERRVDELLEKVQTNGLQSLTDEERRFLNRVSARYRGNRQ